MLYYALVFLVVGVIAGVLHLAGVSAVAVQISWVLFLIGIVLVAIHVITGRYRSGCVTGGCRAVRQFPGVMTWHQRKSVYRRTIR